ncbi:hypothetical protein DSO57_1002930 [Entomophthora muscae]|uniref:Uncharacterized protein n=1 Tax=Entomophthora muscae TaxID=34485 RepID=A0ACC2T8B8_9FUNG|nr:hypothetical protein DSO57_1002930 [Entomophthora muscae]
MAEEIEAGLYAKEVVVEPGLHGQTVTGTKLALLILGLTLSIFVAAMDNTIVATALTRITTEFGALDQVTWVASSYLLTTTALQPLYGKFSDIFGRKAIMLFALSVFLGGSIACGAANSVVMLVVFRAVAGIGGGGLVSLSVIIISDIVPLERRGIYMGLVGANFAVSSVVGPLLGGVLTDKVSWRWAFYINLPICVVAIGVIYFFLELPTPSGNIRTKLGRIDYLGTVSLVLFITLAVLGLNWGGGDYPWDSAAVVVPLAISLVSLIGFVLVEWRVAVEPIIPGRVLTRNVISATMTAFLNGAVFFSAIFYIPIYYQTIHGEDAITAGLELLPLIFGVVTCSMSSGLFMSKTGIYRPLSWTGTFLCLLGTSLMGAFMRPSISRPELIVFLLFMGLGIGLCIQTNTIASQASVAARDVAVVTSLVSFSQSMGAVMGLAVLGAVFQNVLSTTLAATLPAGFSPLDFTNSNALASGTLSSELTQIVSNAYIQAFKHLFLGGVAFVIPSFIATLFLVHIPLGRFNPKETISH